MSQNLPTHDFSWTDGYANFMDVSDDSDIGYIFEVDLEYPDELHDLHNCYPLVPEKIELSVSECLPMTSATLVFGYHFDIAKKRILTQDEIARYMNNSDELSEDGLEYDDFYLIVCDLMKIRIAIVKIVLVH
ncbi:uncharacterized protein TNIN_246631 [Trichonephila inaurata madagascariensis]|uniref:Uncharacterized protein n=1 Tax=Trichonephila inaurata madagascariensis TaxID=2747483 RepID=A0A8X7CRN1_9ARAC|nr:uncharacterized protein TNIN_246631 [Trichonephila inaurata madagascariensis]